MRRRERKILDLRVAFWTAQDGALRHFPSIPLGMLSAPFKREELSCSEHSQAVRTRRRWALSTDVSQ